MSSNRPDARRDETQHRRDTHESQGRVRQDHASDAENGVESRRGGDLGRTNPRDRPTSDRSDDSPDRHSRHRRQRRQDLDDRDESYSSHRKSTIQRKGRHQDPSRSRDQSHDELSRSPPPKRRRRSRSESRSAVKRSRGALPSQDESFRGDRKLEGSDAPPADKQKPNYKPTGLLAKEANTVAGTTTVLKYHEPPEARKPPAKQQWRMYVFKGKELLDTVYLHQRSAWLVGRDRTVTDLLLEHPSISKQHAVLQFRHRSTTNEFGDKASKVKPYLIDLESANGTKLNGQKIEASKFVELIDQDCVAFGDSEREYVLMLPPADS